ncbi:DUF4403 family protein [uncultured Cetobacterium sp.]|uniref:DUF4403 family protein n=1 Tax=uncultured Cetobacterium sp. TaxID=527638 RepID=UPI00261B13CB|nr:DUF4403 family protein [uncultured Cetobacterium sp.]
MKRHYFIFLILAICSSNLYSIENPTSKIDIDISLKKSIVENIINKELPNTIEDSGSGTQIFAGNNNNLLSVGLDILGAVDKKFSQFSESFMWAYKINRTPIVFSAQGQEVQAVTNFTGLFKANWNKQKQGTEINLDGDAGIKSRVSITPNWTIESYSSPFLNISNNTIPLTLNVYGLKLKTDINIADSLEKSVVSKLKVATKDLDSKISSFNLRELVEKYWLQLKEPILINPQYNLWLTANLNSARYSDLVSTDDRLGIKVGADAQIQLYFGEKPSPLNLTALPPINFGFVDNNFNIFLPVSSSYSSLNEVINKNLPKENFKVIPGVYSHIDNIALSNLNNELYITSDFSVSILNFLKPTGIIKATIKPNFDANTETLSSENFDYVLETNSFMLSIANKLFKNKIRKNIIENYLSFNTSKEINLAKDFLQQKLGYIEVDKNVHLKTNISDLKIMDVSLNENRISITFNILGKSSLEILD